ncbi:hypothetical protein EVAR_83313_1 [Eumeta japonica]|uniref:Uncharacterized protein n=1 Tax=Eumeta variegata TaxID=151549 RepID=A0A4C1VUE3_EUMVA|nr:hypothetical protein EVAR_83313_1 [Eumeta japonica]
MKQRAAFNLHYPSTASGLQSITVHSIRFGVSEPQVHRNPYDIQPQSVPSARRGGALFAGLEEPLNYLRVCMKLTKC